MAAVKSVSELSVQGARFYPIVPEIPHGGMLLWLPSVTTALDPWPKPALVPWAAKSEKEGILGELRTWLQENEDASRGAMLDRVLKLEDQPLRYREVSRQAKDIGSSAHAWIEWHIRELLKAPIGKEPILLPGSERARDGALSWMEQVHLEPLDVERRVYDPVVGYAGRYDLKARIDWSLDTGGVERRIVIIDWKASKGIYDDMKVQNISYRQADALTANGSRSAGGVIVRLAKTEDDPVPFEAVQVPYDPQAFETFKASLAFWRLLREREGKFIGGYATEEQVAAMSKKKGRWS